MYTFDTIIISLNDTYIKTLTLDLLVTYKVAIGNGLVEILDAIVWVRAGELASSIHTEALDTLVSLERRMEEVKLMDTQMRTVDPFVNQSKLSS